ILPAFRRESADLQLDRTLAASIVVECDGNAANFSTPGIFNSVSALNTAVAIAVVTIMAAASAAVPVVIRRCGSAHRTGHRIDIRLHGRSRVFIEIRIHCLRIADVIVIVHHAHALRVMTVTVKDFRSTALAAAVVMMRGVMSLRLHGLIPLLVYFT